VAGLQFNRDLVDIVRWSRDSFIASITFRIPLVMLLRTFRKKIGVSMNAQIICV
jgi:hypothetical protein